ncbi:MAG: hypothetical protein V3T90_01665 [Anaerolineae bacterium]
MDDTQPTRALSPDDVETAELPGELGDPTIVMPRVSTGATPTANLPRPIPPPQRAGYVPPPSFPRGGGGRVRHPPPGGGGKGGGHARGVNPWYVSSLP